jgi:nucleotide-binding universal stress UspA family protein
MRVMSARPRRILVGYDGSDGAQRALVAAASLVGYGSTLAVASVTSTEAHDANVTLSEAREELLHRQLRATYLPLTGDPVEMLLDAAREVDADLLVVGARPRNGSPVPDSVSDEMVRRAPCDVLVVR